MRGLVGLLLFTACGGEELTCELLADPNNCWAKASAAMAACIPTRATPGTLAADRKTCSFPDGVRVVFDTPLPTDTFDLERLAFDVEANGTRCARFVDTFANRMELTAGGETVISELHPNRDFHLHCPDEDYETSFDTLFTCRPPAYAPTDGFDVTATSFMFSLSATTTPGVLFSCM